MLPPQTHSVQRHTKFFDNKHHIVMPSTKDDHEYDADGDVKMAVPQPIFEVTRASSFKIWSQSAITTFL